MGPIEDKAALRARMIAARAALTPEALDAAGRAVAERVLALPEVKAARSALVYLSVRREVPTGPLLDGLRARGVAVAVPRVVDGEHMEARALREPLVRGVLGIPTSDGPVVDAVDVALCPGLAFDLRGGRLGYGKGYYDRWLAAHPATLPIALALDVALLDAVPTAPTDVPMALVVTPTRVVRP